MFVTAVHIDDFGPDVSASLIRGLSETFDKLRYAPLSGFVQSMLLRNNDSKGGALLLTFWKSRRNMEDFVASPAGRAANEAIAGALKGTRAQFADYHPTWHAIPLNDVLMSPVGSY